MRFILTVLIALFFAPHPAAASAPHEFYGVISAEDPNQTDIARMGAGGVGTLRINLVWGAVQSQPGARYDWSQYDRLIGEAAGAGIRVLPTVYSSPSFSAAVPNYPPSPRTLGDYAAFVEAAAARYGTSGTFWADHPDVPYMPIRWWQFWNEPNLQVFWLPKISARQLCRPPADVQRRHPSRRSRWEGAACRPLPGPVHTRDHRHPAQALPPRDLPSKECEGALRRRGDIHPYAATPDLVLRDITNCRRIMARFKDRNTPLWVTETGWSTSGISNGVTVSPKRQATYLKQDYELLAANRRRDRIAGAIWYSWKDQPGSAWFQHTGLFTEDFQPKPSWYRFVRLTGGSPSAPQQASPAGG